MFGLVCWGPCPILAYSFLLDFAMDTCGWSKLKTPPNRIVNSKNCPKFWTIQDIQGTWGHPLTASAFWTHEMPKLVVPRVCSAPASWFMLIPTVWICFKRPLNVIILRDWQGKGKVMESLQKLCLVPCQLSKNGEVPGTFPSSGNGKKVSKVGNLEIIRNTFCLVDSHK